MNLKKISILIPCYNEHDNVIPMSEAVIDVLTTKLNNYDYEIVFIDNNSEDGTQELLDGLCAANPKIRAIFNARNFGMFSSSYYGLLQTSGDCTVMLYCDFQEPVELIPEMVRAWEDGVDIVVMQKTNSEENKIMYFLRTCYYKLMKEFSDIQQIEHFTGFGLYDKSFIDVLRELKDPVPFLRGVVAELGSKIKIIPYTQAKRRSGKTHYNFPGLYDAAMLGFTAYTTLGLRTATLLGFIIATASLITGLIFLVTKILYWNSFAMGIAAIATGIFFLGAVILIFLGFLGEYMISINHRLMNRPLVIERRRVNFDE